MGRKIILDCDPGHDDAIAIMLAHGSAQIELLAITTVAGNQTLAKVTRNARAVATVCGITGVPIAAGAEHPLIRAPRVAADIHGESGMDGPPLPEPTVALDHRHAVDLIVDTIAAHPPGAVTLVPTGPLTNIALAIRRSPEIVGRAAGVVLMGGGYAKGNTTAAAEFNILADPEAAHIVFSAPWPVTMVGIDLTHQATATPDVVDRVRAIGTPVARFVVDLLEFFGEMYQQAQGFDAPPVHDPCAVALVADPAVMSTMAAHVAIEMTGTHTRGMTVTDFRGRGGIALDHRVAIDLDRARFWDMIVAAVSAVGSRGPAPAGTA